MPLDETAPPKRRGRPPKGEQTTQVEVADEAAAEQLEEELVETAKAGTEEPSKPTSSLKKKRGRPSKAKGKSAVTEGVAEEEQVEEDEAETANGESVKQYWLMKAEQEDREDTLGDGSVVSISFCDV